MAPAGTGRPSMAPAHLSRIPRTGRPPCRPHAGFAPEHPDERHVTIRQRIARLVPVGTVPKIAKDLRRRRAALAGVSFSWILNRIDLDLLEKMESLAERGDETLQELLEEM